jgi:hypothetical protein
MVFQPVLHEKQERHRDPWPGGFVVFEISDSLPKQFMLSLVAEEPWKVVLLHEGLLGSEVDQRILNQFIQHRIESSFAFSLSQRLVKLVHGVKQLLVLLVENSNVHAV